MTLWVRLAAVVAVAGFLLYAPGSQALTVNVVGHDRNPDETPAGETAVTGYRWVLQEDTTYHVEPGVAPTGSQAPSLSGRLHNSHRPVLGSGASTPAGLANLDALIAANSDKHLFLSVLPYADYSMGAAQIAPGQAAVAIDLKLLESEHRDLRDRPARRARPRRLRHSAV